MKKLLAFLMTAVMLMSVCITPIFADFDDVSKDVWYYDEVHKAKYYGFMMGTSQMDSFTFTPSRTLTRKEFVTAFHRFDKNFWSISLDDGEKGASKFTDYDNTKWYASGILWTVACGISNGISETEFGINDAVTREQIATFIARYSDMYKDRIVLPEVENPVEEFKDFADVSDWAKNAVEIMRKSGIVEGDEKGNFNPKAVVTRAEVAAILVRFYESIKLNFDGIFNTDLIGKIVFDDFGHISHNERKTYEVTDNDELEVILKYLREMPIKSEEFEYIDDMTGKTDMVIYLYDKSNENRLMWIDINSSQIGLEGYKTYTTEEGYFQKYIDIFNTAE